MLSSAMRKLLRLISVMRLITGIPAPKIHRRTEINRDRETGEAGGTRPGAPGRFPAGNRHRGAVGRDRVDPRTTSRPSRYATSITRRPADPGPTAGGFTRTTVWG